jgi:hypothetical protein
MSIKYSGLTIGNTLNGLGATTRRVVRVATTVNGTLSTSFANGQVLDGVTLATGDRILIKNQTTAVQNGIYTVQSAGSPIRTSDYDEGEAVAGTFILVTSGTLNADTGWICTNNSPNDIVGTDPLAFKLISGDVSGPSGVSTDNAIVRWDGTDGIKVQSSAILVDDSNNMTGLQYLQFNDIASPSNPSNAQGRLYKKTGDDGLWWKPDSAGVEVDLTATGGGGGVTSITGTVNQVIVDVPTGNVTLSTPQDIATTSSPTFNNLILTNQLQYTNGIEIGNSSTNAGNANAIAIGKNSTAVTSTSLAFGDGASSSQSSTIAMGAASNSNQTGGIAIGTVALCQGQYGIALGYNANCADTEGIALGYQAFVNAGSDNLAFGASAVAYGTDNVIIGKNIKSQGFGTINIGNGGQGGFDRNAIHIGRWAGHLIPDTSVSRNVVAIGGSNFTSCVAANDSTGIGFSSLLNAINLTYSTGTIAMSAGTITGTGTTFTAEMAGGSMVVGGTGHYITAFTSATQLQTDSGSTFVAGTAYILYYNGNKNTGVGSNSLVSVTTGKRNTAIGAYTNTGAALNNTIAIGQGVTTTVSNEIIVGNSENAYFTLGGGATSITSLPVPNNYYAQMQGVKIGGLYRSQNNGSLTSIINIGASFVATGTTLNVTTILPSPAWVKQEAIFNTASNDDWARSTVDSSGNVYVAYHTLGTVSGGTASGAFDVVIFKLNTNGVHQWNRQLPAFNSSGSELDPSIAVDSSGNVYCTYRTNGAVPGGTNSGLDDIVVTKLDTNGTHQWSRQQAVFNTTAGDFAPYIAVDGSGNSYVCYYTTGTVSGGTASGSRDVVVFKFNTSGTFQWSRQQAIFNTTSNDDPASIAVDGSGNVYVSCVTAGTISGGTSSGSNDIYIFKLDTNGTFLWSRQQTVFNTSGSDLSPRNAVDSSGNVYVSYQSGGTVPGGTVASPNDIVVFKLDTSGTHQWSRQHPVFNTTGNDLVPDIAVDSSGSVYCSYRTTGTVPGGTSSGSDDIVVFKLDTSGTHQWSIQQTTFNTSANEVLPYISVDSSGNSYISYTTTGTVPGGINSGSQDVVVFKISATLPSLAIGQVLTAGSGLTLGPPALYIVSQLTGTAGGIGTYQISQSQTAGTTVTQITSSSTTPDIVYIRTV